MILTIICVMEDMKEEYTSMHLLETLLHQFPNKENCMFYIVGDKHKDTAAMKLKMFQPYDFQSLFYESSFSDLSNTLNKFVAILGESNKSS